MTLSKEQVKCPNKIQFIYHVCLKKFMFSNHKEKKPNMVKMSIQTAK